MSKHLVEYVWAISQQKTILSSNFLVASIPRSLFPLHPRRSIGVVAPEHVDISILLPLLLEDDAVLIRSDVSLLLDFFLFFRTRGRNDYAKAICELARKFDVNAVLEFMPSLFEKIEKQVIPEGWKSPFSVALLECLSSPAASRWIKQRHQADEAFRRCHRNWIGDSGFGMTKASRVIHPLVNFAKILCPRIQNLFEASKKGMRAFPPSECLRPNVVLRSRLKQVVHPQLSSSKEDDFVVIRGAELLERCCHLEILAMTFPTIVIGMIRCGREDVLVEHGELVLQLDRPFGAISALVDSAYDYHLPRGKLHVENLNFENTIAMLSFLLMEVQVDHSPALAALRSHMMSLSRVLASSGHLDTALCLAGRWLLDLGDVEQSLVVQPVPGYLSLPEFEMFCASSLSGLIRLWIRMRSDDDCVMEIERRLLLSVSQVVDSENLLEILCSVVGASGELHARQDANRLRGILDRRVNVGWLGDDETEDEGEEDEVHMNLNQFVFASVEQIELIELFCSPIIRRYLPEVISFVGSRLAQAAYEMALVSRDDLCVLATRACVRLRLSGIEPFDLTIRKIFDSTVSKFVGSSHVLRGEELEKLNRTLEVLRARSFGPVFRAWVEGIWGFDDENKEHLALFRELLEVRLNQICSSTNSSARLRCEIIQTVHGDPEIERISNSER